MRYLQDDRLPPDELAELRLELQESFLLAERELNKTPTSSELQRSLNPHSHELTYLINEVFEGYNDLVRSMGEVPNRHRTPQDNADYIFRSNVELPESSKKITEKGHTNINNIADNLGSYTALMEVLGIFDEYIEKLEDYSNTEHPKTQRAIKRRSRDRQSQIDNLEDELEKYYCEFTTKYETEL